MNESGQSGVKEKARGSPVVRLCPSQCEAGAGPAGPQGTRTGQPLGQSRPRMGQAASPRDVCSSEDPQTEGFNCWPSLMPLLGDQQGGNSPPEFNTCYTPVLQVRKLRQMLEKVGLGRAVSVILEQDEKVEVLSSLLVTFSELPAAPQGPRVLTLLPPSWISVPPSFGGLVLGHA